jgi:hypothetical protein
MTICSNCGCEITEGTNFCPECGMPVGSIAEEAATRRFAQEAEEAGTLQLPPSEVDSHDEVVSEAFNTAHFAEGTSPIPESQRATMPVAQSLTAPPPFPPNQTYAQPPVYYQQQYQPPYAPPAPYYPPPVVPTRNDVSLGDWLSQGWKLYTQNGFLMSFASFLAGLISLITLFTLSGPLLMGLYRMAFKTMRGERPEMNDLFNWEGKFLQSFLVSILSMAIYGGAMGAGNNTPFVFVISLVLVPLMTALIGLVMPLLLDRRMDIAAAVNEVGRRIFSKDALKWWVVGLVSSTIIGLSSFCGIGMFVTVPWFVCSFAIAYRQLYGFDDPNRTLP